MDSRSTEKNSPEKGGEFSSFMSRRGFLRSSAAAGLLLTSKGAIAQEESKTLKIGVVGCGAQGKRLIDCIHKLPDYGGVQIAAICDIWPANLDPMARRLNSRHGSVPYTDFYEMLDKEKGNLDAVLLPVPDVFHHEYSIAAMEAGLAVYCEKMMSNKIEYAKEMVVAKQKDSSRILQLGHQRRSNPRYLHLRNKLIQDNNILGRITHAYAQWNRPTSAAPTSGYRPGTELPQDKLEQYGFESMEQFRNWRMSREFGGGIISDLGAHQIDIFNWVFNATPKSVIASGGIDYWENYDLPDNVFAIYEYDLPEGVSRASYQVLTTTGSQGYYEKFMGIKGTATISESTSVNAIYKEAGEWSWEELGAKGLLVREAPTVHHKIWERPKPWTRPTKWLDKGVDATSSKPPEKWENPVVFNELPHTVHLTNFFETVRAKNPDMLNCTVEDAYRTCVTVLKVYEALEKGSKVEFTEEDFAV